MKVGIVVIRSIARMMRELLNRLDARWMFDAVTAAAVVKDGMIGNRNRVSLCARKEYNIT